MDTNHTADDETVDESTVTQDYNEPVDASSDEDFETNIDQHDHEQSIDVPHDEEADTGNSSAVSVPQQAEQTTN